MMRLPVPGQAPSKDTQELATGDVAELLEIGRAPALGSAALVADALPLGLLGATTTPDQLTPEWLQMQARQLVREFLSVTPRDEETATITIPRADGTITTLTRAHLTAAIERLRPRMRQIVRLGVEGRHSQEEIAAFLGGISTRTVQRDLAEALDLLARLD